MAFAATPAEAKDRKTIAAVAAPKPLGTGIADFYAYRRDYPLWLSPEGGSSANELVALLESARVDGLDPNAYSLDAIHQALATARAAIDPKDKKKGRDNRAAVLRADRLLSQAFVAYVGDLRRDPGPGVTYVEPQLRPQPPVTRFLLEDVARGPSPSAYLKTFAWVNPIYLRLRQALVARDYANDEQRGILALNLERARILPVTRQRYIVVNAAEQKLYAYDGEKRVDEMRVVVGKPKNPTPMMVALIRFAALNPYWYVPPDLAAERIAPRVLKQGLGYLKLLGHEVMTDWSEDATVVDPKTVDWKAVADGKTEILIRQLPGPHNSMGRMKFMFPNEAGIYLHDNPERELFSEASRLYSGGCVRLENAQRLGEWMFNRPLDWEHASIEQQVPLERPVPVYITYLTAVPGGDGKIAYFDDVYSRDKAGIAALGSSAPSSASR
ncbi:MAG: L,D-transpeptidase family protein [Sphingomicrobium sp.]